ncbi:MAG: glycosyl transferase, partial [Bacteroidota bacterium]
MYAGILIGYFGKQDEARKAFKQLRGKGYRRAAWVSKSAGGKIHIWDPFPWRRAFGAVLAFILFGALASAVSLFLEWPSPTLWDYAPIPVLVCGFIGAILSVAWMRRSTFGVRRGLIDDHARWLVSGESVLVLQSPIETLQIPVAVLLESGEIPPAVFILYPKRESPNGEDWTPGTLVTPVQLQEHARRLAADHRLALGPPQNTELLKRIERGRRWVHEACLDLTVANRLEQTVSPAAEWLLDNEYIIEANARKVLLNLPRRYYRQLPALTSEPDLNLPRIYGLAREL